MSYTLPYTRLEAAKHVARPIELAMNARRSRLSLRARASPISRIRPSSCFCRSLCGRGTNSSLDTACVGSGESTPFFRSRSILRIHMEQPPQQCADYSRSGLVHGSARLRLFADPSAFLSCVELSGERRVHE